jgi:RHS repeat-associated protein
MTTYSYDRENRLISQNVDGNVTSFAYDGFGRKRRESRGVNPDVILNWDGDQMIVESSDLDPEAPSKAYYVADGVIYAENANLGSRKSRRDYAVDFLGSVTGLTDSDSGISSVRRWSAYGKLLSGSSEPIGYFWTGNTGSRVYQSLGLNDNRARHYGRNIKQWITRDPLWPSELPYAYVGGNPVTRIDPSGENWGFAGNCEGLIGVKDATTCLEKLCKARKNRKLMSEIRKCMLSHNIGTVAYLADCLDHKCGNQSFINCTDCPELLTVKFRCGFCKPPHEFNIKEGNAFVPCNGRDNVKSPISVCKQNFDPNGVGKCAEYRLNLTISPMYITVLHEMLHVCSDCPAGVKVDNPSHQTPYNLAARCIAKILGCN